MDINQVERILGITKQTVYQHIRNNNLNPVKKGGHWVFDGQEVYSFMRKRNVAKARHSPTHSAPKRISNSRQFSAKHILDLIAEIDRFRLRYENRRKYLPIFEFQDMLLALFMNYKEEDAIVAGVEINDILNYLEARSETSFPEEGEVWDIFERDIFDTFLEADDSLDRSALFRDMLIDAIIELTVQNPYET